MESLSKYVDFDELQAYLQVIPHPRWKPLPRQQHYAVGGSSFYGCPHKEQGMGNATPMVRGSYFHEYYIPKIMDFTGMSDTLLEEFYSVFLYCDKCKCTDFIFGGSIDVYIPEKEWLFDVKFSKNAPTHEEMNRRYGLQVAGYKLMVEQGEKKIHGEWIKSEGKVNTVSIINFQVVWDDTIDNFTFTPKEYIIEPAPMSEIVSLATAFHYARKHRVECFRANEYCKYCKKKYQCKRAGIIDERFMPI